MSNSSDNQSEKKVMTEEEEAKQWFESANAQMQDLFKPADMEMWRNLDRMEKNIPDNKE